MYNSYVFLKTLLLLIFLFLCEKKALHGAFKIHDETSVLSARKNSVSANSSAFFMLRSSRVTPENSHQSPLEIFVKTIRPQFLALNDGLQKINNFQSSALTEEENEFLRGSLESIKIFEETMNSSAEFEALNEDSRSEIALNLCGFNIEELIDKLFLVKGFRLRAKPVERLKEVDSNLRFMINDQKKIENILINFLGNAFKFTQKGWVKVKVSKITRESDHEGKSINWPEEANEKILFEVIDTGIGLHDAEMAKLFKPYVQANDNVKKEKGGTGLGLNICKDFAAILGGEAGVQSNLDRIIEGQQIFTTFWFTTQVYSANVPKNVEKSSSKIEKKVVSASRVNQIQTVAKLSHEMRNVLNPIQFILGQLQDKELSKELYFTAAKNAADLISTILNTSIEAGENNYKKSSNSEEFSQSDSDFLNSIAPSLQVIIADDSKVQSSVLRKKILGINFKSIDLVENGAELIQKATHTDNDSTTFTNGVIFTDVNMPGISGPNAAIEILKHFNNLNPPIIIGLSGDAEEATKKACADAGMSSLLLKGAHINIMKNALVEALQEREQKKNHEQRAQIVVNRLKILNSEGNIKESKQPNFLTKMCVIM